MTLLDCYDGVYKFNAVAGNLDNVEEDSLRAQARCVLEEAKELFTAVDENEGPEQLLKESIDVTVTIFGFIQQLYSLGYDVFGAMTKVNENNLTKVSMDDIVAAYTVMAYEELNIPVEKHRSPIGYCVKDENGKIRKPVNYKAVDVSEFVPGGI
jgi:hypothetical protein